MKWQAIVTCAQKLTEASVIQHMKQKQTEKEKKIWN